MQRNELLKMSDDELFRIKNEHHENVRAVSLGIGTYRMHDVKAKVETIYEIDKVLSKRGLVDMKEAQIQYEAELQVIVEKIKTDGYTYIAMGGVISTVFTLLVMGGFGGYFFKFCIAVGVVLIGLGIRKLNTLKELKND